MSIALERLVATNQTVLINNSCTQLYKDLLDISVDSCQSGFTVQLLLLW